MIIQTGTLCKWADDSQHFLLEHFETIHNSPSHIYHSALLFLPSSSWLQTYYNAELPVKVVKGLPANWGACSRTVPLKNFPYALSCWRNTIAIGLEYGDIITIDGTTGIKTAILSGHTDLVTSLTYSSDGKSLVSGSCDGAIKLWDVQTGGVVKTFYSQNRVWSVSISADNTTIASGSDDFVIHLWNIQTGECHDITRQPAGEEHGKTCTVGFSPTDPHYLLSASLGMIYQLDTSGLQILPTYNGYYIAFSLDGTQVVSHYGGTVTVRNTSSGASVTEFHVGNNDIGYCCFSPDSRLVAFSDGPIAHVWDITNSNPHLVETFTGHRGSISSLVFSSPSTLISSSHDNSVRFWQIGTSSVAPAETDPETKPLGSVSIKPITLQANDGIATTSHSGGMVRTWELSNGLCKTSLQTQAKNFNVRDSRLFDGRLISAWSRDYDLHVWDYGSGELLWEKSGMMLLCRDLRLSEDGSKVFWLDYDSIQAWSVQTGEGVGRVALQNPGPGVFLTVDGSRVWVHSPEPEYQGWDFGTPDSDPVWLTNVPPAKLYLSGTKVWDNSLSKIKDTATGKIVFQLSGRFANPAHVQCDGCYLIAYYISGEILILDFNHVFLQ